MIEEWVVIEEASNYLVSNLGRVYSKTTNRILKPGMGGQGAYPFVVLSNGGPQFNRYVHVLVAETFVTNWDNKPEVNHIDGNHTNNEYWNLEWATHKENMEHASIMGLMGKRVKIVETGEVFKSLTACARAINGQPGNISHCLSGRRRSHRGFTFELID